MSDKGLFVRGSTGLVREAGFVDAVSVNVANMSVGAALGTVGFTLASLPSVSGVNLVAASIIAFTLSIPQIITYTTLTKHIPRTGGDYVWVSRLLGPRFTWLVVGLVVGFIIESLAYYALIAIAGVGQLGTMLSTLGINISFTPLEVIGIGILYFAIVVFVNIMGTKYGIRLMTVLTIASIVTLFLALAVLYVVPKSVVISRVSSLLPSGVTYSKVASQYTGPYFALGPTIMMLPFFAIYIYPWLQAAPAIASEIKSRRAINWNLPTSAVLSMIMVTLGFAAMYYSMGFRFSTMAMANGYVNFWSAAMVASGNVVLAWIIGIGSVLWYLAVLAYGAIVIVRYLFALSFDRILPEFFSYVSPRLRSPVYAHLFDLVITAALIASAEALYSTFSSLYGAVVEALIYFALVGVAAAVAAILNKVKLSRGVRVTLAVASILMVGVMGYISYQFLEYPSIWGGNPLAYGVEIGAVLVGIAIYFIARHINLRRGLDISLVFMEIPPE
ncbi:APC family permease [Caldivirga maquilingensis]|uniref:Amino acid transporter, putative n=1 Tax=Caldivirga maquilingensis (strain ATCC 700844 / DSM 13496 / JCM 10307 / IC-167) TaxID=397948 RepID=A8MAL8_CALMQ|nr:APC family permease [Caldivirga maquilingensis]ABW01054.1 amino acid transporter, putative [Caldivirga maquilingensis IC-167]